MTDELHHEIILAEERDNKRKLLMRSVNDGMKLIKFLTFTFFFIFCLNVADTAKAFTLGKSAQPKNVIVMIGDGMGAGQIEIARQLEYGKNGRLFLESLPYTALVHTYSANRMITDSAAAGTALATGKKTNNEMIGVTPDGKEIDSILDAFKTNGKRTGILTTNSVTDATPAAFSASIANRWTNQSDIARQQIDHGIDVIMGGGKKYFRGNLIAQAKKKGYTVIEDQTGLSKTKGEKILGLFSPHHMSFKIDRKHYKSDEPFLWEMSKKAIDTLNNKDGFFLMIEGARIDHAAHSADLTSVWLETKEFDETVRQVKSWAEKDSQTLVIVVADHETMGLSGTEPLNIRSLKSASASPEYIVSQFKEATDGAGYDKNSIYQALKQYAGMELTDREINKLNQRMMNARGKVYTKNKEIWEVGSYIAERNYAGIISRKIRSISSAGGHTGNPVILFAYGTGAEEFHGVMDNTEVPRKIAELMGYDL